MPITESGHPYVAYVVDSEQADTSLEFAAAVATIMASRYQPRVGDRVRVTGAIAECRLESHPNSYHGLRGHRGHLETENGRTGTVVRQESPDDMLALQGHEWEIEYDTSLLLEGGYRAYLSTYAATELEPLDG